MLTLTSIVPTVKYYKKTMRLGKIIEGLRKGKEIIEIAKECGCSEKTIDRDLSEWKENGGFDKWLLMEFLVLHDKEVGKEEGGQAYRVVADLLKKRLKEQIEQKIDAEGTIKIDISNQVNDVINFSREMNCKCAQKDMPSDTT